ncbi:hypothetical protein HUG17_1324 [Dermatophagoides farinae]|uniref:RING-type domain-containing protein n=1 Tax=Dermatophagoides farinae TaxID=6954 RepID=A0A9D4SLF1_DERFA|nr:hypothetical protein HUG17_1324 [Dermatophagoides farinae]
MSGAWSQLEQLLTCAICLDRFRNPKLLPCQHTFCGEPCMEGLVDYARRQIKCPECRAEHRIPYNGVQSFPNNVTLTRFLDLHRSITGEEPEPLPSQMDRCNVCGEKSYCNGCSHCGKKVCDECRTAHLDILRREINRINSQIRRGLDNLSEHAEQANKGNEKLLSITSQIRDEITESVRRLVKDLKDRETKLLEELDEFTINETKNSGKLKEDFEIELATITSNSELADEHITETDEWTDAELMEFKDIFMKTLDFLRNLDTDSMDYSRKIKYIQKVDLDSIRRNVADFGEIRIIQSSLSSNFLSPLSPADSTSNLAIPQSSLMRSQSDHRLAQFASTTTTPSSRSQRSDPLQRSYLDVTSGQNKYGSDSERERGNSPPGGGRRIEGSVRFGSVHERSSTTRNNNDFGYTRGWQRPGDSDYEPSNSANFRSRFMRERIRERTAGTTNDDHSFDDHDSDLLSGHRVRFQEESSSSSSTTKPKLFDTEEMANMRTPLSGLIKLSDSPHLMERLHQNEIKAKQKAAEVKENESSMTTTTTNATMPPITNSTPNPTPVHRPARQISEDEIEKQKKQNQAAFTQTQQQSTITTNNNTSTPRTITTTNRSSDNNNSSNSSTNITNTSTSVTNRRIQAIQQEEKRSPSSSDDNSDDLNYDDDNVTTTTRPTTTNSSARRRIYASSHVTSGGNSNQSANNFSQSTEYGGESSSRNNKSPTNSSTSTFNNNNQSASTSKSAYYNNKKHNNKSSNIYGASGSSSSSSGGGGGGCVGGSSGISGIGISDMYDNNYDDINPSSYSSSSTTATHNRHNGDINNNKVPIHNKLSSTASLFNVASSTPKSGYHTNSMNIASNGNPTINHASSLSSLPFNQYVGGGGSGGSNYLSTTPSTNWRDYQITGSSSSSHTPISTSSLIDTNNNSIPATIVSKGSTSNSSIEQHNDDDDISSSKDNNNQMQSLSNPTVQPSDPLQQQQQIAINDDSNLSEHDSNYNSKTNVLIVDENNNNCLDSHAIDVPIRKRIRIKKKESNSNNNVVSSATTPITLTTYVPSSRYHHRHRYQHYSSSPSIHITSDTLSSSKNSTTSSPPQRNLSPIPSISSNEQTPYGSAANSTQPSPLPPPTLSASNVPTSPESEQTEEEEEKEPEDIETNNESSAKTSPSESPQPQHSIAGTTTSSILYKPSSSPTQTTAIQTSSSNRDDVEIVTQKENVQRNDENEMDDRPRLYRVNSSDNRFNGELAIPSQLNWLRPSVESQFSSTKNNTDNRQVNQDHVNDGQEEEEEAGDDDDDEYEYVDEEIEDEEENDNEIIYLPGQQEDNNRYLNVKTIENNNELSEEKDSNNNNNNNNIGTYAHYRNRKISRDEDNSSRDDTTTITTPCYNQLGRRNSVNRRNHYDEVMNTNESENYGSNRRSSIHPPINDRYGLSSTSSTSNSYLRNRLAKSKSSHAVAYDDSDEESNGTGNPLSPSASAGGFKSRFTNYGSSTNNSENSDRFTRRTSRSGYTYRTREPSPEEESVGSVTQYLINKYGTRNNRPTALSKSKSSHAIFGRSLSSSDEDLPTNVTTTKYRRDSITDYTPYKSTPIGLTYPRQMYLQKKRMMMKIGSRGTNPSCFTWPRGVACGPDNGIVVADSSNHRIQVFDSTGRFQFEFGSYGSGEGEFDCLAGVTVNRIGHFIVSDRYNHRVQVFDASGRFLRAFGNEGRSDGKFSYPWGIATDALGFIYVCDKENHRIQVFQSDGTFVGKFGSIGSRAGMLEHPHYIAVSNTNRIIVSDSNNHRIQIFDINGRSISTFGSEGSGDGQFKFPRGVAVDENGFIIVGDSGNNRIQIFNPDGTFLKNFGQWGSGEGEFKGLEGVAISSTGNILVCDRENHRIQVF